MTRPNDFLQHVEDETLRARAVSEATCEAFSDMPLEIRTAYAGAMRFLGCNWVQVPSSNVATVLEEHRIRASRLMLLSLYLDTSAPAWSSWLLDRLLDAVMGTPGGTVGDLLRALHAVLGEYSCDLTEPVGNLIKALVVKCFTDHRASYETTDLRWMVRQTIECSTPAQAYLALHAIPPDVMQPSCLVYILRCLVSTPYWEEAVNTLNEDFGNREAQELMGKWMAEEIASSCSREDVKLLLGRS